MRCDKTNSIELGKLLSKVNLIIIRPIIRCVSFNTNDCAFFQIDHPLFLFLLYYRLQFIMNRHISPIYHDQLMRF